MAHSSMESEYKALANGATEVIWLQMLLKEFHQPIVDIPILSCDHLRATYLSVNPIFHTQIKHVHIGYHFVHEQVTSKKLQVQFICT